MNSPTGFNAVSVPESPAGAFPGDNLKIVGGRIPADFRHRLASGLSLSILLAVSLLFLSCKLGYALQPDAGLGLQISHPVSGLSGFLRAGSTGAVQAMAGFDGGAAIKGKLALASSPRLELYAYMMMGGARKLFAGLGTGLDWDWRTANPALPPLLWSVELGFNRDRLSLGVGLHYLISFGSSV